jgi:hypothetical protein
LDVSRKLDNGHALQFFRSLLFLFGNISFSTENSSADYKKFQTGKNCCRRRSQLDMDLRTIYTVGNAAYSALLRSISMVHSAVLTRWEIGAEMGVILL